MASMFGTSGTNGRDAAVWTANTAYGSQNKQNDILNGGLFQSLDALAQGRQGYNQAQNNALGALGEGYDTARADLNRANEYYQPFYNEGAGAVSTLGNSLGINGGDGNQQAINAFQAGPGYEFQRDQAADLAARNAARLGIAGSGNTLTALGKLGSNLANQEYGNWQNRLANLSGQGLQAAGGMAQGQQSLANLASQNGLARAGLYGQYADRIGQGYGDEARLFTNNATQRQGVEANTNNTVLQAGQAGFKATEQAAQNRGNLAMQGVKLGTSLLGSYFGGM